MNRAAVLAFKAPGKMSRLKSTLFGMLPYHRQAWPAGRFSIAYYRNL